MTVDVLLLYLFKIRVGRWLAKETVDKNIITTVLLTIRKFFHSFCFKFVDDIVRFLSLVQNLFYYSLLC